jgi:hypothetical protein
MRYLLALGLLAVLVYALGRPRRPHRQHGEHDLPDQPRPPHAARDRGRPAPARSPARAARGHVASGKITQEPADAATRINELTNRCGGFRSGDCQ